MSQRERGRVCAEALAFALAMSWFAAFAHRRPLAAAGGLMVAAAAVVHFAVVSRRVTQVIGLGRPGLAAGAASAFALTLGVALGALYRSHLGKSLLPARFMPFAATAVAIGAAEELFYRGYVQGRLSVLGAPAAVVLAALAHAAYKTTLFALPPPGHEVNVVFLPVATFLGGIVFGGMRALSSSILPPLIAHVCFDLVAYGDLASAPWWGWS